MYGVLPCEEGVEWFELPVFVKNDGERHVQCRRDGRTQSRAFSDDALPFFSILTVEEGEGVSGVAPLVFCFVLYFQY